MSSNRSGTFNIWRIKIDGGGGLTRITTHANRDFSPDLSPDGKQLVFHSYSPGDPTPQIWTCEINGTSLTQNEMINRGAEIQPSPPDLPGGLCHRENQTLFAD
jgi:Tol biopolymer transport system component